MRSLAWGLASECVDDDAGLLLRLPVPVGSSSLGLSGRMSEGVGVHRMCGQCNRQDEKLLICSGCKAAWYCSQEHQKLHWKKHKLTCRPKNGTSQPNPEKNKRSKRVSKQTDFGLDASVLDTMLSQHTSTQLDLKFQSNGDGGTRHSRRRSQVEPDLSTTIDPNTHSGEASSHLSRPRTPSLLHVEVCPESDSQDLADIGFNQEWFNNVTQSVVSHLNQFGVCVIDNFLGEERAEQILSEVGSLHTRGVFHDGQVVSRQEEARGRVRGDKITWVTGAEPQCGNIGQLVNVVDSLIGRCNSHIEAGKLATYTIKWRTRPMVACYPGQGTHYVKHVDNPNGDGRCITAIYYINKDWRREDGGMLRIFPEGMNQVAEIEPLFDRMLFFWSDRRNPHEVMPASVTRYAITVWYLDQREREDYLSRMSATATST